MTPSSSMTMAAATILCFVNLSAVAAGGAVPATAFVPSRPAMLVSRPAVPTSRPVLAPVARMRPAPTVAHLSRPGFLVQARFGRGPWMRPGDRFRHRRMVSWSFPYGVYAVPSDPPYAPAGDAYVPAADSMAYAEPAPIICLAPRILTVGKTRPIRRSLPHVIYGLPDPCRALDPARVSMVR